MTGLHIVLIGRNEGPRLVAALASLCDTPDRVVYVDSGSTDDSVAAAKRAGATVVELDMSVPFTAARARNAGFDALNLPQGSGDYVQFIDGDCALAPGWLDAGRHHLDTHPKVGMVTGWRCEIHPEASLYNRLSDWEWHRPAGQIDACGGDMMVRAHLWQEIGGMNPVVIAGEDDDVCIRMRKAGWLLHRLPQQMTRHDAAMLRFGQWWRRAERTGHAFGQVGWLHPEYFTRERQRTWIYGLALPVIFVLGLFVGGWPSVLVLALYVANYLRTAQGLRRDGLTEPFQQACLIFLSKFPNLLGLLRFHFRRLRGAHMTLIEYK
ncbi:glycosyltransferase [Sagittula sp. SSi028]|uniref:glycosyltransferase n=1 Tax=Sagittula sp. SSi028 TaxID=3400636 RepID=UPI003AF78EE8